MTTATITYDDRDGGAVAEAIGTIENALDDYRGDEDAILAALRLMRALGDALLDGSVEHLRMETAR